MQSSKLQFKIQNLRNAKYYILNTICSCQKQVGFTLIELIIVICLVSSLAFIATKVINPFVEIQKRNDDQRKQDLLKIQQGVEKFYRQFGYYPQNPETDDYRIKGFKTDHQIINWGEEWKPFLDFLPKDPDYPSKTYIYYSVNDGQTYYLYASLNRGGNDLKACKRDGSKCDNAPLLPSGKSPCGGVCNYGVSSRNVTP